MTAPCRVAVIGVYHETNTFSPIPTDLDSFRSRWYVGEALRDAFSGTSTVIGGFLDGAAECGIESVPVFGAFATPSGPVTARAFAAILAAIGEGCADLDRLDGVFVELHGDFAVTGRDDPEQEIIDLIRSALPGLPIAVVLDLHANMAQPRLTEVDVLVGYRTNPHVDTAVQGARAAHLLDAVMRAGLRIHRAQSGLRHLAVPSAQLTAEEPLSSLLCRAAELEAKRGLLDVTVHGGYAYGDSRFTGIGFSASADVEHAADAEAAVAELLGLARETVGSFRSEFPDPVDAVADAIATAGTVAIADIGDNINGGTPGDTTWLLHEVARHSGVRVLATIADRQAIAQARQAGVGGVFEARLGGRASPRSGGPVTGAARVLALSDGTFVNEGPMAHGAHVDMGGAAVVRIGDADVLLQERAVQPNDSNMFRSLGVDIADYDVILLKGAAALRADWSQRVVRIIDAATIGETDPVLARLAYRHPAPES